MKSIKPVLDLMRLAWIDLRTWGQHPLSPYTPSAVIRRNEIERPTR